MAVFAVALTITSPFLPEISSAFSVSMAQSGIVFTANFIGFAVFVFIGGILADRWGKKKVISFSLIGFTVSLLIFPLSVNFTMVCSVMFFIGGFGGIIESMVSALVADINPENTSYYINLSQVFFGIGALIGPISAGIVVSSGVEWKSYYYVIGAISVIFTVAFLYSKMDYISKPESITWAAFRELISDKKFLFVCLCMAFYTGTEVGTWGWMSTFLKENMKFSIEKSSVAVGLFWLSMTVGRVLCGHLTLRYKLKHIIAVLAYLSTIVVVLSGLLTNEVALWIIIAVVGLAFSSLFPLIVSYGENQQSGSKGTVFALLVGSGSLGTTIIPLFMGIIGEKVNIRTAMVSPAILMLVIALGFTRLSITTKGKLS